MNKKTGPNNKDGRNIAIIDSGHNWAITPLVRELIRDGNNVLLFVQNKKAYTTGLFPELKGHIQIPTEINRDLALFLTVLFSRKGVTHVICLEEDIKSLLIKYQRYFKQCKYAFPGYSQYRRAVTKLTSIPLAMELGIPTPKEVQMDEVNGYFSSRPRKSGLPLVVKGSRGVSSQLVRYAFNSDQVLRYVDEIRKLDGRENNPKSEPLIQEYIGGPTYLTQTITQNGKVKVAISHRKIREWPLTGGVTTRAVTIDEPRLSEYASRILEELNWHGEAGFEWKYSREEDEFYFIEMNPRFEGSLAIAVEAGINFPRLLIQMMEGNEIPARNNVYKKLHFRYFYQLDLLSYLCRPSSLLVYMLESIDPKVRGEFSPVELLKNYQLLKTPILNLKYFLRNQDNLKAINRHTVHD